MDSLYVEFCDPYDGKIENFWMKLEHIGRYLYVCDLMEEDQSVLDISCANGYGCRILANKAKSIIGLDINRKYIEEAKLKTKSKKVSFGMLDLEKPNKATRQFDFIVSFETLEHLTDYKHAIKFLSDSLKVDGTLIVSFPNTKYERLTEEGKSKDIYHLNLINKDLIIKEFKKQNLILELELGQTITNIAINNEISKIKSGEITEKQIEEIYKPLYEKDKLDYFAKIMAYPNKFEVNESYSYILKLKKI